MSKTVLKHYGRVVNGKKVYYNIRLQEEGLRMIEGKEFVETVTEKKKGPTPDQHGYYRGGVILTAADTETFSHLTPEEIHELFAYKFLSYTKSAILPGGRVEEVKTIRSTAELSRNEMNEFIEKVIAWLNTDYNIIVLSPEDYHYQHYKTIDNNG